MPNYYESKYQTLQENGLDALNRIVEILLYQSTSPKLPENTNKFQLFWQSGFVGELSAEHLSSENYRIAFSQYLRYGKIERDLCRNIADICPESFVSAVRKSGMIGQLQHNSWAVVDDLCRHSEHKPLLEFIAVVDSLHKSYEDRLKAYQDLKRTLNLGQLSIMLYSSLYTYEYLLPKPETLCIPYQIDPNSRITVDKLWQAFNTLLFQTTSSRKPVSEKSIALLLRDKLVPFLWREGLTPLLIHEYEQFKYLVALRVELDLYQNFVFNSYSYQEDTKYSLQNGQLQLENSGKDDSSENWLEKFSIIQAYWQWRGMQECVDTSYFLRMDRGKNLIGNMTALAEAQGIILRLQEVFGIYEHLSNQQPFDLFEAVLSLELSQQFYRQDFINQFVAMRQEGMPPFQALLLLMLDGLQIGENRLPMTFWEKDRKAVRMSDWILSGSKTSKKKSMAAILDFWSQDLRKMEKHSYAELPYYQADGIMLELPHRFGLQNLHTTVINHFRRLNKNRPSLGKETDRIEVQLAELFEKYGWQVLAQHEPEENGVGEIDLIVIADKQVLVLELKSTFIKQNIREIYEYRYFVLKKAAYQLSRKCAYVRDILLPKLGYKPEEITLHSWIVDTTLEFDHQYIDGHLKISLEELLIQLRQHNNFMEYFDKDYEHETDPLTFEGLLDNVEQDRFWQKAFIQSQKRERSSESVFSK